jgi:hypothetical protein
MSVPSSVCLHVLTVLHVSDNMEYYEHFTNWQSELTPDDICGLRFFDECRVDLTGVGTPLLSCHLLPELLCVFPFF